MRVDSLALYNFKGITTATAVDKLNLLVGPNGSHKSAHLQALQFAVLGHTSLGGRLEDTAKLASGIRAEVGVQLDDGFAWLRRLNRDPRDGRLSMELDIAGEEGLKLRDAEPVVANHVGSFAPMFDLGAFLDLSDDKRRAFVLELCAKAAPSKSDPKALLDRILDAFYRLQLGEGTVKAMLDGGKALHEIERQLAQAWQDSLATMRPLLRAELKGDVASAVGAALDKATSLVNSSKDQAERATQAARKLSEQKAGLPAISESAAVLAERREKLLDDRTKVTEQIAHQAGRQEAIGSLTHQVSDVSSQIAAKDRQIRESESKALPDTDALQAEVDRIQAEIEAAGPAPDLEALKGEREKMQAKVDALTDESTAAHRTVADWEREIETLTAAAERFKDDAWMKAWELWEKVNCWIEGAPPVMPMVAQQTCAQLGEHIKQQCDSNPDRKAAGQLDSTAKALAAKKKHVAQTLKAVEAANIISGDADVAYAAAVEQSEALNQKRQQVADLLAQLQRAQDEVDRRDQRLSEMKVDRVELVDRRVELERKLNGLLGEGGYLPIEQLAEQREAYDEQISALNESIAAKQRLLEIERVYSDTIASAEAERTNHEVAKVLAKAVRVVRETLMVDLVKPMTERVDAFLSYTAHGVKCYCELVNQRGRPIFELGWIRDGRKVPLPALSGGETAIFSAALAYALVSLSDAPLKVLLIEAAEVDILNLHNLLRGLSEAATDVSNIFVATCWQPRKEMSAHDWNIIDLKQEAEVAGEKSARTA